jgi:hypothetical protein
LVVRGWSISIVLAACTAGEPNRGDTATFGSGTVTLTTTGGSSSGSESSTGATTTTAAATDTSTTADATASTTSGAIDPDSSTGDVAGGCPPEGPLDCSAGMGSGEPETCDLDGVSCFLPMVQSSVMGVVEGHPEWIDETNGTPFVLEPESYMNAVVDAVSNAGLCAIRDPNAGDEIAVKHDNAYAESFDILSAEGNARWGDGIYTATCAPSWF